MSVSTIFVMRHGEKPKNPADVGLTAGGLQDPNSLTIRGWQRAGAWAVLFGSASGSDYPVPKHIFAADPRMIPEGLPVSQRPYQTVTPLAEKLGIKINTDFKQGDEAALADALADLTGVVLVSWEHKLIISDLMPGILAGQRPGHLPAKWPGSRFDTVLRFSRVEGQWAVVQCFPLLLAGDLAVPFPET